MFTFTRDQLKEILSSMYDIGIYKVLNGLTQGEAAEEVITTLDINCSGDVDPRVLKLAQEIITDKPAEEEQNS